MNVSGDYMFCSDIHYVTIMRWDLWLYHIRLCNAANENHAQSLSMRELLFKHGLIENMLLSMPMVVVFWSH